VLDAIAGEVDDVDFAPVELARPVAALFDLRWHTDVIVHVAAVKARKAMFNRDRYAATGLQRIVDGGHVNLPRWAVVLNALEAYEHLELDAAVKVEDAYTLEVGDPGADMPDDHPWFKLSDRAERVIGRALDDDEWALCCGRPDPQTLRAMSTDELDHLEIVLEQCQYDVEKYVAQYLTEPEPEPLADEDDDEPEDYDPGPDYDPSDFEPDYDPRDFEPDYDPDYDPEKELFP
jgi:hypothetical protein